MTRKCGMLGLLALLMMVTLGAVSPNSAEAAPPLTGHWSGYWASGTSGHRGPLSATFYPIDEMRYQVRFKGRFFKLVPFRYTVVLNVVADHGDHVELAGSSYLGRLFGTFSYHAMADGASFSASFQSRKDAGRFELRRHP